VAISLLSAVLCGLAPALQTTRTNLVTALKAADADIPGRCRLWGRNTLVICQVAASLALLTAALQMVRTFQDKWRGGPGFRTDHLFTMTFDPQLVRFTEAQTQQFYKELVRRTRLLPGVRSATLTGEFPMSNDLDGVSVIPEGYRMPRDRENFQVDMDVADESYFKTLGVRLLQGREFRMTDTATSPKVAIVNEQFAKQYWPNGDALGKRFRIDDVNSPLIQIVGISKTAKYEWIGEPPTQFVYLPFTQHLRSKMTLLIESKGASAALAAPLRELVRNLFQPACFRRAEYRGVLSEESSRGSRDDRPGGECNGSDWFSSRPRGSVWVDDLRDKSKDARDWNSHGSRGRCEGCPAYGSPASVTSGCGGHWDWSRAGRDRRKGFTCDFPDVGNRCGRLSLDFAVAAYCHTGRSLHSGAKSFPYRAYARIEVRVDHLSDRAR